MITYNYIETVDYFGRKVKLDFAIEGTDGSVDLPTSETPALLLAARDSAEPNLVHFKKATAKPNQLVLGDGSGMDIPEIPEIPEIPNLDGYRWVSLIKYNEPVLEFDLDIPKNGLPIMLLLNLSDNRLQTIYMELNAPQLYYFENDGQYLNCKQYRPGHFITEVEVYFKSNYSDLGPTISLTYLALKKATKTGNVYTIQRYSNDIPLLGEDPQGNIYTEAYQETDSREGFTTIKGVQEVFILKNT